MYHPLIRILPWSGKPSYTQINAHRLHAHGWRPVHARTRIQESRRSFKIYTEPERIEDVRGRVAGGSDLQALKPCRCPCRPSTLALQSRCLALRVWDFRTNSGMPGSSPSRPGHLFPPCLYHLYIFFFPLEPNRIHVVSVFWYEKIISYISKF